MQHHGKVIWPSHHGCDSEAQRKSAWSSSSTELGISVVEGFHHFQIQEAGTFVGPCAVDRRLFEGYLYWRIFKTHNDRF